MTEAAAPYHVEPVAFTTVGVTESMHALPVVHWFARLMQACLDRNAHKGDWHARDPQELFGHLRDEVEELYVARQSPEQEGKDDIIMEALDVACLALMIADVERERRRQALLLASAAATLAPEPVPEPDASRAVVSKERLLSFINGENPPAQKGGAPQAILDVAVLIGYADGGYRLAIPTGPGHESALAAGQIALLPRGLRVAQSTPVVVDGVHGAYYTVTPIPPTEAA